MRIRYLETVEGETDSDRKCMFVKEKGSTGTVEGGKP